MDGDQRLLPWRAARLCVAENGCVINGAVYRCLKTLFFDDAASQGCHDLTPLTNEFRQDEFLLVVAAQGDATGCDAPLLADYQQVVQQDDAFARWFRLALWTNGEPVLLAARWLCHLVGLRHVTVEIFLDLPNLPGFTLVQVRGLSKAESPGAFDLPCAGHVSGVDTIAVSLAKELNEELGLALTDLDGLREISRLDAPAGGGGLTATGSISPNREYRVLFWACLKPECIAHIRFYDGEVAGLAVFGLPELRSFVARYPERTASGLREALPFYPHG